MSSCWLGLRRTHERAGTIHQLDFGPVQFCERERIRQYLADQAVRPQDRSPPRFRPIGIPRAEQTGLKFAAALRSTGNSREAAIDLLADYLPAALVGLLVQHAELQLAILIAGIARVERDALDGE
jgi:hypothetical protein